MKQMNILAKVFHHKKTILLSLMAALSFVSILSVGPTYAYLKRDGGSVVNSLSSVAPSVVPTVKSDYTVTVGDTGYSVRVRAAITVTWQDADGNISATAPAYTMTVGDNWVLSNDDGFYYYSDPVASNGTTDPIFTVAPSASDPPEGFTNLYVDVLVQTVQAAGFTDATPEVPAPQDAWGHTFS